MKDHHIQVFVIDGPGLSFVSQHIRITVSESAKIPFADQEPVRLIPCVT